MVLNTAVIQQISFNFASGFLPCSNVLNLFYAVSGDRDGPGERVYRPDENRSGPGTGKSSAGYFTAIP